MQVRGPLGFYCLLCNLGFPYFLCSLNCPPLNLLERFPLAAWISTGTSTCKVRGLEQQKDDLERQQRILQVVNEHATQCLSMLKIDDVLSFFFHFASIRLRLFILAYCYYF